MKSHEDFNDVDKFPTTALDYLCIGMRMPLPQADIARALEKLLPAADYDKQLTPFTAKYVDRVFEYLRSTGSGIYDIYFILGGEEHEHSIPDQMLAAAS